jgi:TDG/mug DNA glycosylase family protein
MIVQSLPPIADKHSKILILGSMAGTVSLQKQQYYGHPQNHFWRLLCTLFDAPCTQDYEERISLLKNKGIALWDSIAHCEREGSLDKNIKNETPNDIGALLREFPGIQHVFCNGQKSFTVYHRHFAHIKIPAAVLPSTSPIPRKTIRNLNDLIAPWSVIKSYLL